MIRMIVFSFLILLFTFPARAAGDLAGPVEAMVVRVIDGDTIEVRADVWPGIVAEASIRLAGVDAPELRGACEEERALARAARDFLGQAAGGVVRLMDIEPGKYAGRIVARVLLDDGTDVSRLLLEAGLARPYGGGQRKGWCS